MRRILHIVETQLNILIHTHSPSQHIAIQKLIRGQTDTCRTCDNIFHDLAIIRFYALKMLIFFNQFD
ncbi:Uncharacterised protein [Vibrio cholerae]|uniref:Uncharacterized protein n=1 Tax=Vibrio cholerae TaxID=666 RepID=A0A656A0S7_VIBCL|nr:Uncharacterised protein [Vibrio cholerae]CSA19984.1 Uncharacterised protein [Vibrio cholerae]CSA28826.1 Uncharacterised protein [Vibrio cholerae]CSA33654.1 Uncharacterised protein [Vibrio cholerae]CSA48479.1 Uncharacterised protein [Vibrio cholerae]